MKTREQCKKIVQDSDAFYCKETTINGKNVEIYNYRLASYSDFKEHDALELRGLTFVEEEPGRWETYPLLPKFFNVNECEEWMIDDLSKHEIIDVQNKEDGSIISFVYVDEWIPKSKASFESDQAFMAKKFLDKNKNLTYFLNFCKREGFYPIFELVSPKNKIVLDYEYTDLVLLKVRINDWDSKRNKFIGEYLPKDIIEELALGYNLSYAKFETFTLQDMMKKVEEEENKEGWVIHFNNNQFAKLKTKWYFEMHKILSPDAFREDIIIRKILNEEIDDILSQIEGERRESVIEIRSKIDRKFNSLVKRTLGLLEELKSSNRKDFAISYSKEEEFSLVMRSYRSIGDPNLEEVVEKIVKEYILSRTDKLSRSIDFLSKIQ